MEKKEKRKPNNRGCMGRAVKVFAKKYYPDAAK